MLIPIAFGDEKRNAASRGFLLAGDIGATKTNLALFHFEDGKYSVLKEEKFPTKQSDGIDKILSGFLSGTKAPDLISLGVAGPVTDGLVSITNVPWQIDAGELSRLHNNIPVYLINDLEATAYGLAALKDTDIHTIHEGSGNVSGNIALIAPGTGLGEAGLFWDGNAYRPFATEGGHCDFSPKNELDSELYVYLHKKYEQVSWERLISGNGIVDIYEFLRVRKERDVPSWLPEKMLTHDPAAVISGNAENAAICRETMGLFLRYLATEAANLVLKFKATGGVYIGGGIMPKILRMVHAESFMKWFQDFDRMKPLLNSVPVSIVLNERTALLGAAYYGAYKKH